MLKAYDIEWDIDVYDAIAMLDEMPYQKAAEAIGCPQEDYANMTTEERHDYAYDAFHHHRVDLAEFMGLPDEVEIPESVGTDDEDITEWLSDTTGFCIEGYRLSTDEPKKTSGNVRTDRDKLLDLIAYIGDTDFEIEWLQTEFGITDQDILDAGIDRSWMKEERKE